MVNVDEDRSIEITVKEMAAETKQNKTFVSGSPRTKIRETSADLTSY